MGAQCLLSAIRLLWKQMEFLAVYGYGDAGRLCGGPEYIDVNVFKGTKQELEKLMVPKEREDE